MQLAIEKYLTGLWIGVQVDLVITYPGLLVHLARGVPGGGTKKRISRMFIGVQLIIQRRWITLTRPLVCTRVALFTVVRCT